MDRALQRIALDIMAQHVPLIVDALKDLPGANIEARLRTLERPLVASIRNALAAYGYAELEPRMLREQHSPTPPGIPLSERVRVALGTRIAQMDPEDAHRWLRQAIAGEPLAAADFHQLIQPVLEVKPLHTHPDTYNSGSPRIPRDGEMTYVDP